MPFLQSRAIKMTYDVSFAPIPFCHCYEAKLCGSAPCDLHISSSIPWIYSYTSQTSSYLHDIFSMGPRSTQASSAPHVQDKVRGRELGTGSVLPSLPAANQHVPPSHHNPSIAISTTLHPQALRSSRTLKEHIRIRDTCGSTSWR